MTVGNSVDGTGVFVGRDVSVGKTDWVIASDVAKMACPVNATTVGRELADKGVCVDSASCEQADNSPRKEASNKNLYFMCLRNQYPAGSLSKVTIKPAGCFIYRP